MPPVFPKAVNASVEFLGQRDDDAARRASREPVDDPLLTSVRHKIRDVDEALRTDKLLCLRTWDENACGSCDLVGLYGELPRR